MDPQGDMTTDATDLGPPPAIPPAEPEAPPAAARPKMPKWETDARERVRVGIRKFAKPLADFVARDVNEADTKFLITDFLCEALGYDKFSEVTAEFAIRGDFADYGLRIDKQLVALIEAKRATTKLSVRHLHQVEDYGVREGVDWLILTNGAQWQVYHLGRVVPIVVDLVIEVDLLGPDNPAKKVDRLFPITREGMRHGVMDRVWKAKRATSPKAIARVLTSPAVVTAVRKELRRETEYAATDDEVLGLVRTTIKTECL
jgi:predicted type IV restriction endonuclease